MAITTILYSVMFLLPTITTHKIQGDIVHVPKLGNYLDFCASQEVATQCASRSQCGCSYQAQCHSMNRLNQKTHFNFTFSMNSNNALKEMRDTSVASAPLTCGIQYRIPIDESIKQHTTSKSRSK